MVPALLKGNTGTNFMSDSKKARVVKSIMAQLESGNDPKAVSATGAVGRYQFTKGTTKALNKKYGTNLDRNKEEDQEKLMGMLLNENASILKNKGVPVKTSTLYAIHNVGPSIIPVLKNKSGSKSSISNFMDKKKYKSWAANPSYFFKRKGEGDKLDSKDIKLIAKHMYKKGKLVSFDEANTAVSKLSKLGIVPMSEKETSSKYSRKIKDTYKSMQQKVELKDVSYADKIKQKIKEMMSN